MSVLITGSIAYDYIMQFPGYFHDHILPDKIANLSVSFLVDSMKKQRGGVATNIAYNLALLGERPRIMATVGQDFGDYRAWLEAHNVDTCAIIAIRRPWLSPTPTSRPSTTSAASTTGIPASIYPGKHGKRNEAGVYRGC
jgi:sugar/nucleoside kinase (ribokinase family)